MSDGPYASCSGWLHRIWIREFDNCNVVLYVVAEVGKPLLNGSLVKIGITTDPDRRLRQLQTGCPFRLEYKLVVPGTRRHESLLHHMWRYQRLTGEWFVFSDDIGRFIGDADNSWHNQVLDAFAEWIGWAKA